MAHRRFNIDQANADIMLDMIFRQSYSDFVEDADFAELSGSDSDEDVTVNSVSPVEAVGAADTADTVKVTTETAQGVPVQADKRPVPMQVVRMIVAYLRPANPKALLAPDDVRTRTLLALTRVSKACYMTAAPVLLAHCVYLDTRQRLKRFVAATITEPPSFVKESQGSSAQGLHPVNAKNILLRPFPLPAPQSAEVLDLIFPGTGTGEPPVPVPDPGPNPALLLPPVGTRLTEAQEERVLRDMLRVFGTCKNLRRIVFDVPMEQLYSAWCAHNLHRQMRRRLQALPELKEIIALQEEHLLNMIPAWGTVMPPDGYHVIAPALRPLLCYNPLLEWQADVWMDVPGVLHQELVVLTGRSTSLEASLGARQYWLEYANAEADRYTSEYEVPLSQQDATVEHHELTIVEFQHPEHGSFAPCLLNWGPMGPSEEVRALSVKRLMGPRSMPHYYRNEPGQRFNPVYAPLMNGYTCPSPVDGFHFNAMVTGNVWRATHETHPLQ